MSTPARDNQGRFAGALPLHELLDGVAEVARAAAGEADPQAISNEKWKPVSKEKWNRARIELERFDLPTAEGARRRIGLAWPVVIEVAVAEPAKRGVALGVRLRRDEYAGGKEEMLTGLKIVAHRIAAPLDPVTYDLEAVKLNTGRVRRGLKPLSLATSQTIIRRFEGWPAALRAAGLPVPEPKAMPHRSAPPAAETLDGFLNEIGLLPTRNYFEAWCRARDIPLGRDGKRWDDVVAATRARRAARGESTPAATSPRSQLPPLPEQASARERRQVKAHTREAVHESLRRYARLHLGPSQQPRQKHYLAAARRDPKLVAASTLGRHGRFQELCREAGI